MKLVIAEKPSVAQAIAKVLGAHSRREGYLEGNDYLVSWCVGHLVGLAHADAYDERYAKWRHEDLPIIPEEWRYDVSDGKKKQFNILKSLMERRDVESLVEATDAGREGELIFRLVYHQAKCKKPFKRLWISSMEDRAIADGFKELKDSREYDRLYEAAVCRSKADWIVGINGTRLFSTLHHKKLTVGRVQTPTLTMLVERNNAIETFFKEKYFNVHLMGDGLEVVKEKLVSEQEANALKECCNGHVAVVAKINREQKSTAPPRLYDLTTLQREANRYFGYTAQQTLDVVQQLYEKKLVTYPRTDSQYITSDMQVTTQNVIEVLSEKLAFAKGFEGCKDIGRIINNSKITDHHAIIPTLEVRNTNMSSLTDLERDVFNLIAMRLLCATAERQIYEEIEVAVVCANNEFRVKGKTILTEGWKDIEKQFKAILKDKKAIEGTSEFILPELYEGQTFENVAAKVSEHFTSPPKQYTEDTLLSAMETAGNTAFDQDTEKKGLGTPATRASIIEKLVHSGYVVRKGKQLIPTKDGSILVSILPESIKSPTMTAEWENTLMQIEKGNAEPTEFFKGIVNMITNLVNANTSLGECQRPMFQAEEKEAVGVCPRCGNAVYEGTKGFFCADRNCGFALWKDNKFFAAMKKQINKRMAVELLKNGRTYAKKLYSAKTDCFFEAAILMSDSGGKYVSFKLEFPEKGV